MLSHRKYAGLATALVVSFALSIGLSNALSLPPTSQTATGSLLSSLNFGNYSGSTLFGIPMSIILAVIISALVAFIIYGALKGTHLSNGAGVIGMLSYSSSSSSLLLTISTVFSFFFSILESQCTVIP